MYDVRRYRIYSTNINAHAKRCTISNSEILKDSRPGRGRGFIVRPRGMRQKQASTALALVDLKHKPRGPHMARRIEVGTKPWLHGRASGRHELMESSGRWKHKFH